MEFIAVQPRTLVPEAIGLLSSINSELRISEETATHKVPIIVFNSAQETHKKQEIPSLGTRVCSFRSPAVQTYFTDL